MAVPLDVIEVEANDEAMNGPTTMSEQTATALLASNEALHVAVSSIQSGQQMLLGTVQKLQETVDAQGKRLDKLQETAEAQEKRLDKLQDTVEAQGQRLDKLQETAEAQGRRLDKQQIKLELLHATVQQQQKMMDQQQKMIERLHETVVERGSALDKLTILVEANQATLQALQRIAEKQQESIGLLQNDVAAIKVALSFGATKGDTESIRAELYRTISVYTIKGVVWVGAVCSAVSGAVYFIARNVH